MAYDIPDKIQYKEKIVFNLTFKQLCYAILFAFLAFFTFNLKIYGDAKLILPSSLGIIGFGFIFMDLEKSLTDRWTYVSGMREGGAMDKKVQKFIGVKKIEDDTVYLATGPMRAVLSITPINFQNLDEGRKKSVIGNYRSFLNQLTHPIQILVRTVNVDVGEYFAHHDERVAKTRNPQLIKLYEDFKQFEMEYLNKNKVKERLYYIIVPYDPAVSVNAQYKSHFQVLKEKVQSVNRLKTPTLSDDEAYRKELSDRTTIIQQKLREANIVSRRLSTNELISLYMSYFDGYAEVDEDYLSRYVVGKQFLNWRREHGKTTQKNT